MPSLQYQNKGRGGRVVYTDEHGEVFFEFEFGADNCVAIIFVPDSLHWEKETGRPISQRQSIIEYTAVTALTDQVSNGYYTLSDNFIELYSHR